MAHVHYTYMVAYVYHSMSFVLYECLQGRTCYSTTTAGNLFVLIFEYLIVENCQSRFLLSICSIPYAFEVLHLFYRDQKNPFSSSIVFAQSLTYVFLSLSGKS